MEYLRIEIDNKFKISKHISYVAERCTKLIHSLTKSTKVSWGLKHGALQTTYKGAILPLLLYGAPVWIEAMQYKHNRQKYIRMQRHMNIRIAKVFQATSSEALCILTGMTPIIINTEEVVKQYNIIKGRGSQTHLVNSKVELKTWPCPADAAKITEAKQHEEHMIQAYTDGSKNEQGGGSRVVIFAGKELLAQIKLKLDSRCSNNQA
jgi:hypothetical protein